MVRICRLLGTIETAEAAGREGQLSPEVGWLGLRADLIGDDAARGFASRSTRRLLYRLGPEGFGSADRERRLIDASNWSDLVELEYPHDLGDTVLSAIRPEARWITWRGPARDASDGSIAACLASIPASVRCIESAAVIPEEGLDVLALLRHPLVTSAQGAWVIHARGPAVTWTRALAPWIGTPLRSAGSSPGPVTPRMECRASTGS